MRAYWFRRLDSRGQSWRVYVCTPDDCPRGPRGEALMRDGDYAVTLFCRRWICLNPLSGEQHYPASLLHEWQHVEQHNEGLHDGEIAGTRMHRAIEAAAVVAARIPLRPPPRIEDYEDE